jgi:TP53 regulating kinase-like protein
MVDAAEGLLGIEWIDGRSVKYLLPSGAEDVDGEGEAPVEAPEQTLAHYGISVGEYVSLIAG